MWACLFTIYVLGLGHSALLKEKAGNVHNRMMPVACNGNQTGILKAPIEARVCACYSVVSTFEVDSSVVETFPLRVVGPVSGMRLFSRIGERCQRDARI